MFVCLFVCLFVCSYVCVCVSVCVCVCVCVCACWPVARHVFLPFEGSAAQIFVRHAVSSFANCLKNVPSIPSQQRLVGSVQDSSGSGSCAGMQAFIRAVVTNLLVTVTLVKLHRVTVNMIIERTIHFYRKCTCEHL